ncbi:MAG: glycosyltransferase [bacterium]
MPEVSVIMNCLNCAKYLREAIESVYAQTYKDWEIIFWDNASTDGSACIAKSYDSKLNYFRGQITVPLGKARNLALNEAKGKYIAFLDCDDIYLPEKLEKQMPLFKKNNRVGLVAANEIIFYEQKTAPERKYFSEKYPPPRGNIFSYALANYSRTIPMDTVVIRSEILHTLDEWFMESFHVCTDFELFLRILHDWEFDYVNEPLVRYRVHQESAMHQLSEYTPGEIIETLEGLSRRYPDFCLQYKRQIAQYYRLADYLWGKYYWMKDDRKKAREYFKKHLYHPKMLLTYMASIISFNFISKAWYWSNKYFLKIFSAFGFRGKA